MSEKIIGPNRQFDPEKETKDEYEMGATFPVLVFKTPNNRKNQKSFQKKLLKDEGDSALVGRGNSGLGS